MQKELFCHMCSFDDSIPPFCSAVFSFVGMLVGTLVGGHESALPWIFMATAGIFIYIALVDMMPELSSGHAHPISKDHQKETRGLALFLQVIKPVLLSFKVSSRFSGCPLESV